MGIATIVSFADKESPEEITEADLEAIADYMAENYRVNPLRSFLTVVFPNADGYTQPAYFKDPDKQADYMKRVLRAFRPETPTLPEKDVFLEQPVADISFNVNNTLPPGRAFRQHVPLQTAVDIINFHPYGQPGLPISGLALLAFQAYPLGSAKCQGRTLSVHSDNPAIMRHFAATFLERNRKAVALARQTDSSKLPETPLKFRTLLIQTLLDAADRQMKSQRKEEPCAITAYHLTNSGQRAALDIYYLPSQMVGYLQLMLSADYSAAWAELVRQAWVLPKLKRGQKNAPADFQPDRNYLYEDLFNLAEDIPGRAGRFIRIYFLRDARRFADQTDPRGHYSTRRQAGLVSWKLTEPFLRRILHMEAERVAHIRALGDALAVYVGRENDRRFFRNFYTVDRYDYLRTALIKANNEHVRRGNPPFLTLDNFLSVFEEGEELARPDWRLARDLVLIRMVEQLHASGWLGANADAVPEVATSDEISAGS
ncbi:MAG: type I-B CRISPR-associated protein Cas8b1/Cst1 [Chloroflexi bacterium]|nr:type I-B CRISPR-associated protein Cas8b1/Cst1 [Chloroflexota bacterium]